MKKMSAACLALVMLFSFLAGCQNTPEKPVVIGKDTEQLMSTAKENTDKTLSQMLNAPDRMKLSTKDASGTVTVNADAEVLVPKANEIPTVRIKKHAFTQQEADKILQFFVGNKDFNNRYQAGYDADVERLIKFKAELAKEKDPAKRAELQASIDKFESAGIKVTEPQPVQPAARTFAPSSADGDYIKGVFSDGTNDYYLQINNNSLQDGCRVLYTREQKGYAKKEGTYYYEWEKEYMSKSGLDAGAVARMKLSLTGEGAQQKAKEVLTAMGLDSMVLSTCEEVWGGTSLEGGIAQSQGRHAYQLEYVRSVNGVPITRADNDISANLMVDGEKANEKVAAGWPCERLHFIIDDTGIAEFIWQSPYEISETVTKSSAVKPFSEIQNVFSKMILITNAYQGEGDRKLTMDISKARLGLMRITEKNNIDTCLLVPVWDFFGTAAYSYTGANGQKQTGKDPNIFISRLTVNAIDGSVINRSMGY